MGLPVNALRLAALTALGLVPGAVGAQVTTDAPVTGRPVAIADLRTEEGARVVHAEWRFAPATVVAAENRDVGQDLRASGAPNRTLDIAPHAGAADFDDSGWQVLAPTTLDQRRTNGKLSFAWYRLRLTIPRRIGSFDPTGATAVFEIVVDDYAEVWVDGRFPAALGQTGSHVIKGFNAPNRVVLRNVKPDQKVTLAVFTANGPLSNPPTNFIWVRSATLDFYRAEDQGQIVPVKGTVERKDPALDAIVPPNPKFERIAQGFLFTEGPVWVPEGGYLLFSDPNANTIYRWNPDGQVSVFRTKSGYTGVDVGEYGQPGSNGLTLDAEGRLTINEHGNQRVVRMERPGNLTVLADQYQGKRLNSPNDLVYRSDGALFFTDPPFGLPKAFDDLRKELRFSGVYCVNGGQTRLVSTDLDGPNGLALSPDEKYLYVDNWNLKRKVVMRYEVNPDCTLRNGQVFVDLTNEPGEDALDGLKVDQAGNVYVSGPRGVWVISPKGKHLGTLVLPDHPHNFAWGDEDGRTLYLTARSSVYRVRLNLPGIRPPRTATSLSKAN
jgi:gluconolactonase